MGETSLKEKTAKGLFWGGFNNGMNQLLNLAFGIFLARLLSPADYGMVGMLGVFSAIAGTLMDSGFGAALVNKKDIRHCDYNAVFWFTLGMGVILYIILFLCAPLIARFYNEPVLTSLSRYSFLTFLIGCFGSVQGAYLFRNLKVKQRAITGVIALILSGTTGVVMAFHGYAYWGIATQNLVYLTTIVAGSWIVSPWRPTLHIDFKPLKGLFAFGSKLLITNIFNTINGNIFSIMLGKFYSAKEVGYYNQANKWCGMGHSFISGMIGSVAQPILVQVSDDGRRQLRVFRKMLRFASFVSFPLMLGFSSIAPEVIAIAITDKWAESAQLLQILCIGGCFVPIATLYSTVVISHGKSDIHMWSTIGQGLVQMAAVILIFPYGMRVMVIASVCINIAWLAVWHHFVRRYIRLTAWLFIKDVLPYAAIAAACIVATHFLTRGITGLLPLCLAKIAVTSLLYVTLMWFSNSVTFRETISYLYHKNHRQS